MIVKWTLVVLLIFPITQGREKEFLCNKSEIKPFINIAPVDALISVNVSTQPQSYIVNPERINKTFVINCTSYEPVDWRFKGSIGNTITRSERSMSYEGYEQGEGFTGTCYYSALIFSRTEDEITGQYTCIVRPSLNFNPQTSNGLFNQITLFSGLSPLTIRNETKTYDLNWLLILIKDHNFDQEKHSYRLPCAKNHPDATLSLSYSINTNTQDIEWTEVTDFVENPAVSVTVELYETDLPRKYKCEAKLGNHLLEWLYIDIPSYPDAVYWPDVPDIVYKTNNYNTFYCISRLPIRFLKDDKLPTTLQSTMAGFVQHYINMGFNYTAAVTVNTGNRRQWDGHNDLVGTITCQDTVTNGSLINWSWKYDVENGGKSNKPRNYLNGVLKKAVCKTSVNPEETKVRYIAAAKHAELSLQQKCLQLLNNEWNICNHPKMDLQPIPEPGDDSSFYVTLPFGTSGAFQCLTPDVFNDHKHYVVFSETTLNELGNVNNPYQEYIQFSTSSREVVQFGDTITATCTSSQMYFHGAGIWVLIWRNSSHSSVPSSWILAEDTKKVNTFYERRANITAGSTDLIGITCVATLIQPPKDRKNKVIYPNREFIPIIVKPKAALLSFLEIVVIVLAVSVVVIVGLIAAGFSWLRKQELGKNLVFGHEQMVEMFFHGYEPRVQDSTNPCETAESQPYDTTFELVIENLTINWDSPLGAGAYGFVLNGTYIPILDDKKTKIEKRVAVKTLKDGYDNSALKALMSELKVMIYIGNHPNLLTLIGAITDKLSQGGALYVVLEHCENGSLDKYMMANRGNFLNNFDTISGIWNNGSYTNLGYQNQIKITSADLFNWSRQIISGMNHLVSKKVIHGDLAARNILLDGFLTAKISDFGLSRRLFEQYEYVKKSQEPLPWRNMALESLRDLTFSSETDVWSFGVLVWEIFSLSETPYKGKMYSSEFISMLEAGYRLSSPQYAPGQIYDVMVNCWHEDPRDRPTFQEIADTFDDIFYNATQSTL